MEESPIPSFDPLDSVVDGGHLWLHELVDGFPFSFVVEDGGWLAVAGPEGRINGEIAPKFRPAMRFIRETVDRSILADVPDDAVFSGVATVFRRIEYDWDRLPAFLGTEVRSGDGLLAPDAAEHAFTRLELPTVPTFEKEVAARHFSIDAYEVPDSHWRDGSPLGVLVRNKAGGRGRFRTPGFDPRPPDPPGEPADDAATLATPDVIEAVIAPTDDPPPAFDERRDRIVARILRRHWAEIVGPDRLTAPDGVIDAIEAATREYLLAERPDLVD